MADLPGISMIVFGLKGAGKSVLGDTTPSPRLVLDAEMGSRFTSSKKTYWDPLKEKIPEHDGTWDTCLVTVRTYDAVLKAYEWLNTGQHPFRSVVVDSISEVQQRLADSLKGDDPLELRDWGEMLRKASLLVRNFRDLTTHPVKPLDAVLFIAMATQRQDGTWYPHVQGQLKVTLPYYVDLLTYLAAIPQDNGTAIRRLLVGPTPGYATGERVGGRLGHFIDNPNVTEMLSVIHQATDAPTPERG
jgi:hypothetical protein